MLPTFTFNEKGGNFIDPATNSDENADFFIHFHSLADK